MDRKGKGPCWPSDNREMQRRRTASESEQGVWEQLPPGWVKVNVDGSFVPQTGGAGLGVVIRNSDGEVLLTAWKPLLRCAEAAEVEAMACLEGLRLTVQHFQSPAILESDCARVVHALSNREDRSELGFLIREAIEQTQA